MTHSATRERLGAPLPFSRRVGAAELEGCARRLVGVLGLKADVRVFEARGRAGLEAERRFRLAWWTNGCDPLRASLQRLKVRVFREAGTRGKVETLAEAWRRAECEVSSANWRGQLRELASGRGAEDIALLRLAFRAAQQAWSRDARWRAIMPESEPSPFAPLLELFEAGAWPLGCQEGVLGILLLGGEDEPAACDSTTPPRRHTREGVGSYVFLSAKFRDSAVTRRWGAALTAAGWATLHGPVGEEEAAPEAQLGARIRSARAVVGICDAPDPDFGLPWWMFQELDYARACGLSVFLACRGESLEAGERRLAELCAAPVPSGHAESGLRSWLVNNAPSLWEEEG